MANWEYKIKLKDLLGPEDDDSSVRETAREFAERLKRPQGWKSDGVLYMELEGIIEELEDIANPEIPAQELGGRLGLCSYFNDVLNGLYNWADYHRVWID